MIPEREVSVAAALSVRGGRVFLARRGSHKQSGGLWELPGGKVEAGEAAASALARELREELGLEADVDPLPYDDSVQKTDGIRFRFLVFRVRWEKDPSASTDHDCWKRFLPEEIPFRELAPLDRSVLRRWGREAGKLSL